MKLELQKDSDGCVRVDDRRHVKVGTDHRTDMGQGMIEIHVAKATDAGGSGNSRSRTKGTNGMSDIGDDARRIEVKTKILVTSLRRVIACANANCCGTVAFVVFDTNADDSCCSLKGKQRV